MVDFWGGDLERGLGGSLCERGWLRIYVEVGLLFVVGLKPQPY